jgi:hypothetical protein
MKPGLPARRGGRRLVTAASVMTAAAALVTGCGGWPQYGHGATQHPATAAFPAPPMVSGPGLARLWETHSLPCDHPIAVSGRPADPYHLLETGMWPDIADVTSRLAAVTATGGQEFILGRLRLLGAVLLQTQSDITDQVKAGTHEIDSVGGDSAVENVVRDESMRVIKLRHDNYVAAVNHVIGELGVGAVLPSAQVGRKYRLDRVCPHG